METMHSLNIADPRDFYRLPLEWQMRHVAHTRNVVQGAYASDLRPLPDYDAEGNRKRRTIDAQELFASVAEHKHAPPSQQVIDNARMVLSIPGLPDALQRDARETLQRAGLDA